MYFTSKGVCLYLPMKRSMLGYLCLHSKLPTPLFTGSSSFNFSKTVNRGESNFLCRHYVHTVNIMHKIHLYSIYIYIPVCRGEQ